MVLKSFILSMNQNTIEEAEFLLTKARKISKNMAYDYSFVPVIQKFFKSFKPLQMQMNTQTKEFEKVLEVPRPSQEIRISIQKFNIRGLEKFIKDLNDQISKICPFADKLAKLTGEKEIEIVKRAIVSELKDHKMIVEFKNTEEISHNHQPDSVPVPSRDFEEYLTQKMNYNIDKIYQAEYEKELKDTAITNEAQKQTNKSTYSGIKKRSAKRRSNMHKTDSNVWDTDAAPNHKQGEGWNPYAKYSDGMSNDQL